jgi:hypothetical protein
MGGEIASSNSSRLQDEGFSAMLHLINQFSELFSCFGYP